MSESNKFKTELEGEAGEFEITVYYDRIEPDSRWYNLWYGSDYQMSVHRGKNRMGVFHDSREFGIEVPEAVVEEFRAEIEATKDDEDYEWVEI